MQTQPVTLLTIIAEAVLQEQLCELALALGASGYTVTACSGSGSRGVRSGMMEVDTNVKVEILAQPSVANTIASAVERRFAANYALVLFMQPVTAVGI